MKFRNLSAGVFWLTDGMAMRLHPGIEHFGFGFFIILNGITRPESTYNEVNFYRIHKAKSCITYEKWISVDSWPNMDLYQHPSWHVSFVRWLPTTNLQCFKNRDISLVSMVKPHMQPI